MPEKAQKNITGAASLGELARSAAAMIKRDSRLPWVFTLLLAVLLGLWGKVIVGSRGPSDAAAARLGGDALATGQPTSREGVAPLTLARWAAQPVGTRARDLFTLSFQYFQKDPNAQTAPVHTAVDQTKLINDEADQRRERQNLIEDVQSQAAMLSLESTVMGARPRVWVDHVLVGLGQEISNTGFIVMRIEPGRVMVRRNGIDVELSMK